MTTDWRGRVLDEPDDPLHHSDVANCSGCHIEYDDREPSLNPRIVYCADHDAEEHAAAVADLEAALRALVAVEPLGESDYGGLYCCYCPDDATLDPPGSHDYGKKGHHPDCPWVRARTLLGHAPQEGQASGTPSPRPPVRPGAPAAPPRPGP
jgi:hypothetical protein